MTRPIRLAVTWAAFIYLLSGCASAPTQPHWKSISAKQLEKFGNLWLQGDTRNADAAYRIAHFELSRTGKIDLAARLEISRCAYMNATFDEHCGFTPSHRYYQYASSEDKAYFTFISGKWDNVEPELLDPKYRPLLLAKDPVSLESSYSSIQEPVSKIIAASAIIKKRPASRKIIESAIQISSDNGWARSLTAWLNFALTSPEISLDQATTDLYNDKLGLIQNKPSPSFEQ